MKEKIMKMFHSILAGGVGLLFLLLLLLPYTLDMDGYLMVSLSKLIGGDGLAFMIGFMQFFHIVSIITLVGFAIIGILKETGVIEIKKSLKNWNFIKVLEVIITVMASLSFATLIFVISFCATKSVYIQVGSILNPILEILFCVAYYLLHHYGFLDGTYVEKLEGMKKAKAVESTEEVKEEPVSEEVEAEVVEEPVEESTEEVKTDDTDKGDK